MRFSASGLIVSGLILLLCTLPVRAQVFGPLPPESFNSISQNSISNMGGFDDTVWIGPLMLRNVGNDIDWIKPEGADSVIAGRGRLFSIDLAPDTVMAGIGFNDMVAGSSVQTGMGFYRSTDNGQSWDFIPTPLDDADETTFLYGGQEIETVPVIVPQQSPPFNVKFKGSTVFAAGWASGIRRSHDFGETWERILLPPSGVRVLQPEDSYDFVFDPRLDNNFLGFSVMIDSDDYVWAGTAGGVNISPNAMTAPTDSIRWVNSARTGSSTGMLGNWVIRIKENTHDGGVWMTNWIATTNDQQGIVVSYDKGQTFEQHLAGERITDLAFDGPVIYAAGDNGLFISPDNGTTWNQIRQISNPNGFIKESANYLSLAMTNDRLWVGTTDGLASTDDGGETWQLTRVNFPLSGGNQFSPDARSTRAYAYPNPYSPRAHEIVRIKFEAPATGNATIRLYDFGMNLIRNLEQGFQVTRGQEYEAVWDGTDGQGRRAANGAVFYRISVNDEHVDGKFLLLD